MRFILVFLASLLLSACDSTPRLTTYYSHPDKEKEAAFIAKCIESGNSKSGEKPEDWLVLCMGKATELYGKREIGFFYPSNAPSGRLNREVYPCSLAESPEEKSVCRQGKKVGGGV